MIQPTDDVVADNGQSAAHDEPIMTASEAEQIDACHQIGDYMLREFARVCADHDIKFFLAGGTLLGAVRNGGWIPWDDDIDISIGRSDYEKFLAIANDSMPADMYLSDPQRDADQATWVPRINFRDSGFRWVERAGVIPPERQRIVIDLYIFDPAPDSALFRRIALGGTRICQTLSVLRATTFKRASTAPDPIKVRIVALALLPISRAVPRRAVSTIYQSFTRLGNRGSRQFSIFYNHSRHCRNELFRTSIFANGGRKVWFEGTTYRAPDPDDYLVQIYGPEFMTPPPPAASKPHYYEKFWARFAGRSWGTPPSKGEADPWLPVQWR